MNLDQISIADDQGATVPDHADRVDSALHWYFYPIANSRAHEEVVEQLVYAILSGAYLQGERLPGVDQLAQAMNVSKPVISEALRVLTKCKALRVQRGVNGGLFVLTNRIREVFVSLGGPMSGLGLAEIVEARCAVELQLALLAGERATDADFAAMQSCIDGLRKYRDDDLALRIRFDHLFHYSIGRAARSRALARFQFQILEHLAVRMRDYFLYQEDPELVLDLHESTLAAIRTREPGMIRRMTLEHLRPLEERVAKLAATAPLSATPLPATKPS